jgi:hypothetical protein
MNAPLRAGDIVLFDGGNTSDVLHLITNVLSNGIEVYSRSKSSHTAMVWPLDVPINGQQQNELYVIESTIRNGINGVQLNPLAQRVAEHERSWGLRLSPFWNANLDYGNMWQVAAAKLNKDRYNVLEIAEYLLRYVPIIGEIPAFSQSTPGMEVCSELMAILLRAGRIPGLHPALMSPQAIAELAIYENCIQLNGTPAMIARFNTV